MQKIKNSIIDKMIAADVTSKEIDFVLYISRYQNNGGRISGVHYREVCEEMNMSYQGFYDVKQSLIDKKIIASVQSGRGDHDIVILDNEFLNKEDAKIGYINTNHNMFFMEKFYDLKAGAKLLAMWLMKVCFAGKGCFEIGVDRFYEEYPKKFGVSERVMRHYLMSLKENKLFSIEIKKGKYTIKPEKIIYKKPDAKPEAERMREHETEVVLRRNRIKQPGEEKIEVCKLFLQYESTAARLKKDLVRLLDGAIRKSLEIKNEGEKWIKNKILDIKLIHKLLKELLYSPESESIQESEPETVMAEDGCIYPKAKGYRPAEEGMKINKFNNFAQRIYDNDELERLLLRNIIAET